jgi:hypothetical protein
MADFRLGRLKFNWRGAWVASTAYVIDDIVSFKGNSYVCVVNHTSASSEGAWASTDLDISTPKWSLHVPGIRIMGAWTSNTFYAKNDLISYGANQYLCVTNHTSPANETLFYTNNFTAWSLYSSGITYKGDWVAGTWYKLNDVVKYGNSQYLTTNSHTSGITFNTLNFSVYFESLKFEDTWSGGGEYQPGDIVTFGGYTYIAKTINSNKQPNIYSIDQPSANPPVVAIWNILTTGFSVKGEYDDTTVYVPGDVVRFGGDTYVKIITGAAGVYPIVAASWTKVSSGLNWKGPWSDTATYQVNDVVSKSSGSWVNLTAHNLNIDPVADQSNGATNWQSLAQGDSLITLSDPGDLLYKNNAGANTNLAIGTNGQVLTAKTSADGTYILPTWERNNSCANIFYVATDGVDIASHGKNISRPWATLRYALATIPAGTAYNINTIFVKSGTYAEQLPLVVPPYTSIVGDNMRSTIIKPLATGTAYTTPLTVTVTSATTFTVDAGVSQYLGAHTFVSCATDGLTRGTGTGAAASGTFTASGASYAPAGNGTLTITTAAAHNLESGNTVTFAPDCLTFKCSRDGYTTEHSYPTSKGMSTDSVSVENRFSTMFTLSDSTTLKDLIMIGMEGFEPAVGVDSWDITQATVRGVFLRLNPNNPIVGKSPYITQCSAFSGRPIGTAANCTGGVGAIVDKSIYGSTVSNGSMLFDSFTQFHDLGVGFWCKDLGNAEIVSSFTYYAHIGYTCTGGARIRSLAGNNSWGTWGCVSSGYDNNEVAITGKVRGQRLNFVYLENSPEFKINEEVVQGTDPGSGGAIDYSVSNANYALALVLHVGTDYLIIEPITGLFTNSKPVKGFGATTPSVVVASDAVATTGAGGASPALEGIKGKIFTLTDLPVSGGAAVLPRITGATKFVNVAGNATYNDSGYYVISEVVNASTASNLNLGVKRQYDVPGIAPNSISIAALSRTSNVATVTTSSSHGLSTGDKVTITIANTSFTIKPYATGYASSDLATLGIRGGIQLRETVTVLTGDTFTYSNAGADNSISAGDGLLTGSVVNLVGTSGGSTKALHQGGSSLTLYNTSTTTGLLNSAGVAALTNSTTAITFADESTGSFLSAITADANHFLLVDNELMNVTAVGPAGVTVTRGDEGTTAEAHADGSILYYVTKVSSSTTLRGDVDTAVTALPVFSIGGFDQHDLVKINSEFFKVESVNSPLVGRATIIFAQPKNVNANDGQSIEIRLRYSQVRLTGHDFLQIGTGSRLTTNWPATPATDSIQENEVYENYPGRVYYVSTDQDGNFRVGTFFKVEQATGTATLDATAFNLSGLSSLRLGTLGAELGVSINEFSSDVTLGADFSRDTAVPTQLAVKTYVDNTSGGGIARTAPMVGVSTLTSVGTVATVTSFLANNVYTGDTIVVSGAAQANYNGTFTVTAIDLVSKTFTYTMPGTAVSPATGTIAIERKQKVASDLNVTGITSVTPTWDTASSTEAFVIDATNTNSGAGTNLIKASVGGVDKFAVDKDGNVTAAGNLTVSGTTTTVNSTDLSISDKTIIIGSGATTGATADGAGLQLGTASLSFKYNDSQTRWDLQNAGLNIGGVLEISGTTVLSSNTLGSGIVNSSLTSIGTLSALNVTGKSAIQSVTEAILVRAAGESGNKDYDFDNSAIHWHPSVSGNIIANIINVPTTALKSHTVVIVFVQDGSARNISSTFGVNGSSITVKWSGGTQPAGEANKNEAFTFTIINTSTTATPSWTVLGSATAFS